MLHTAVVRNMKMFPNCFSQMKPHESWIADKCCIAASVFSICFQYVSVRRVAVHRSLVEFRLRLLHAPVSLACLSQLSS